MHKYEEIQFSDSSHGKTRVYWANKELTSPPLVILHGWGTGSACFFKNVAHINAPVMLVDLPGFGHSERKDFGTEDPFEIEKIWSTSLVEVIQNEVKEDFWLAGHSFGCYLSAKLCMDGVLKPQGLILLDPWVNFISKIQKFHFKKSGIRSGRWSAAEKVRFSSLDSTNNNQNSIFSLQTVKVGKRTRSLQSF
jgi:pimeloyl-ACP methyl ester carboxylesterase